MNANRRRIRFHFWLDINKEQEAEVADTIAELKRERSFTSVLREGILIVSELRRGKVDTLLTLYPWIRDAIGKPEGETNTGNRDLENRIQQLERMLLYDKTPSMISRPSLPEPEFVVQKDTSQDAAKNLLGAMGNLM